MCKFRRKKIRHKQLDNARTVGILESSDISDSWSGILFPVSHRALDSIELYNISLNLEGLDMCESIQYRDEAAPLIQKRKY